MDQTVIVYDWTKLLLFTIGPNCYCLRLDQTVIVYDWTKLLLFTIVAGIHKLITADMIKEGAMVIDVGELVCIMCLAV